MERNWSSSFFSEMAKVPRVRNRKEKSLKNNNNKKKRKKGGQRVLSGPEVPKLTMNGFHFWWKLFIRQRNEQQQKQQSSLSLLEVLPWRRRGKKKEGRRKTSIFDLVISPKWIKSSLSLLGAPGFGVTGFARFPYSFLSGSVSLSLTVLFVVAVSMWLHFCPVK